MFSKQARKYSEALVEIAQSQVPRNLEEWKDQLSLLTSELKDVMKKYPVFTNPSIKVTQKKNMLQDMLGILENRLKIKFMTPIVNMLMILIQNNKLSWEFLNSISAEVANICDKQAGIMNATIVSAVPLEDTQIEGIKNKLSNKYNKPINMINCKSKIDERLIGGVRINVDGQIIDYSIIAKLEELKEKLKTGR